MDYIKLGEKEHPIFFGGAARRRLLREISEESIFSLTSKIAALSEKETKFPEITSTEMYDVFIPCLRWGIWGGYRFEGENVEVLSIDDVADLLGWDMAPGWEAMFHYLQSLPRRVNGEATDQEVEEVKKKIAT